MKESDIAFSTNKYQINKSLLQLMAKKTIKLQPPPPQKINNLVFQLTFFEIIKFKSFKLEVSREKIICAHLTI